MGWKLNKNLKGKTYVVTGTSAGIGTWSAIHLARAGATVIAANRNVPKAEKAHAKAADGAFAFLNNIDVMECDMSSFESVRQFAKAFQEKYEVLDGIIHNAGGMNPERKEGPDGHELTLTITNASPQLLTSLLIPQMLKAKDGATVVATASWAAHDFNKREAWDDMESKKYNYWDNYAFVKSGVMQQRDHLIKLAKEAGKEGQIRATVSHPGASATDGGKGLPGLMWVAGQIANLFMTHPRDGGLHAVRALVDAPDGAYVGPNGVGKRGPPEILPPESGLGSNAELGQKLWDYCNEITGADWSALTQ